MDWIKTGEFYHVRGNRTVTEFLVWFLFFMKRIGKPYRFHMEDSCIRICNGKNAGKYIRYGVAKLQEVC